jgi:hypothetical protein
MKLRSDIIFIAVVVVLCVGYMGYCYLSIITTVQSKANASKTHTAKLVRYKGIDINFAVQVDGERIYFSPDFAPVDYDFREQIAWDKTGTIVVLEVAGKRLFGFDADRKRQLSDEELYKVEYIPFSEYRYEGKLPAEPTR